jgi:AcrR family transcriptional regulator
MASLSLPTRHRHDRQSPQDQLLWTGSDSVSMHSVLLAAVAEFEVKGFHGASTRAIASRAGMSAAAVYLHYSSKESLLFEICMLTHRSIWTRLQDVAALSTDPADRLRAMVAALAIFHAEVSVVTRISTNELHCLKPKHRAEIESIRHEIQTMIKQTIADGVEAGIFRVDDLDMITFAILSMTIGIARWFSPRGRLAAAEVGLYYSSLALSLAQRGVGAGYRSDP